MREIEIVFTKSKKFFPIFSWAIMLWTGKSYSHVARKMKISFLDKPNYFQASEGKVNWEYEDYFSKKHKIVKTIKFEVTDAEYKSFNKSCWEQIGDEYGLLQNLGIVFVDIASFFGIKLNNPLKKGQNCSEVLYRVIFKPKFSDLDYNPDVIKPHHIEEILTTKYRETQ